MTIQRREKLFLVKDQRSFIEKGTCLAGPWKLATTSKIEIRVRVRISIQTKENVNKAQGGKPRHARKIVNIGLIR